MQRTVNQWVEYIQTLHVRNIDMSLERIRAVFARMHPDGVPFKVVSVAGTNGKGSTSELLSSIYRAAGYRVGKYTSPHLVQFNERVELLGEPVDDVRLLVAFERVESQRGDITITYFEYATLVAIEVFCSEKIDIAVMEVGLGGRLDAVNMLDADLAIITNISIDHTAWLGDTVEQIAVEKAGIARAQRPCVIASTTPPKTLIEACQAIGAEITQLDRDFCVRLDAPDEWAFVGQDCLYNHLPLPFGQLGVQLDNASGAIQAVVSLLDVLPVEPSAIAKGLRNAAIRGRCQVVSVAPMVVVDVSHNVASVSRLQQFLSEQSVRGRIVAVCGMLRDKQIHESLAIMAPLVDEWYLSSIEGERGSPAQAIDALLQELEDEGQTGTRCFNNAEAAYKAAVATLTADDCLVVFGSFYIVGDILQLLEST
ncbi:bifunctional tetrahydrofolate synthase/dihydrofolate synthase [Arenicella xantha]|uniref:Dihydrofolate synthase/folylpolyglutamate synthase n=1 Tax=Arenicella xantha TaxID=644221 RepID=A0A395JKL8_9GAMM|nr:bifunctional tetrahydrofolate synthase/dihydrofolate synthase [Arenicella xantha]RBP50975.1 dihydrofolate synthase/folylpolyglutamate synthase [Arenicella xantha]